MGLGKKMLLWPRSAAAPSWSPTDLGADLEAWYANSSLTAIGAGNPVATWPDSSGNARDIAQATGSKRPVVTLEGAFLDCRADGTDDQLDGAVITIAQPYVFAGVARFISGPAAARIVWGDMTGASSGPRLQIVTGPLWSIAANGGPLDDGAANLSWHRFVLLFNGASSYIRIDGAETVAGNCGAASFRGMCMHARSPANAFSNTAVRETLVISKVPSAGELSSIETYLSGFI